MYGYANKIFRVTTVEEDDTDILAIKITALEYDPTVYSTSGLIRKGRSKKTGIIYSTINEEIQTSNDRAQGNVLGRLLLANAAAGLLSAAPGLLSNFFKFFTRPKQAVDENGDPIFDENGNPVYTGEIEQVFEPLVNEGVFRPKITITAPSSVYEGQTFDIVCSLPFCPENGSQLPYEITGVTSEDISVPLIGTLTCNNGEATLTVTATRDAVNEGFEVMSIKINDSDCNVKKLNIWFESKTNGN
jgi:hypothetical protein